MLTSLKSAYEPLKIVVVGSKVLMT